MIEGTFRSQKINLKVQISKIETLQFESLTLGECDLFVF